MTRLLVTKLRRDLLRNWTQFTAVFLMALLSVMVYTGLEGAWYGLDRKIEAYATDSSMADAWVYAAAVTDEDVQAVREVSGVETVAPVTQLRVQDVTRGREQGRLALETSSSEQISVPVVVEGEPVAGTDWQVWIDRNYAEAHDLSVGDMITVSFGEAETDLEVAGLVLSPDKIYYTGTPSLVAPAPDLYGYGIVTQATMTIIAGAEVPANTVRVAGDVSKLRAAAPDIFGERYLRYVDRDTNADVSTAFDRVTQIRNLSILFSFIFILLALLAMYTSVRRLAEMQKRDVATLKALGYSNRTIGRHFASYGLVTGGVGGLLGLAIAPVISLYVLSTQKASFALPEWSIAYTPTVIGVAVLVAGICTIGAYAASRPALRGMPAEGMRDQAASARRSIFERARRAWGRMSYGTRWTVRDAGRNPVLLLMGVIAVAGCMMLLFAGFGMPDSMNGQVTSAFVKENTYTARVFVEGAAAAQEVVNEVPDAQLVQEAVVSTLPDDGFDRVLTVLGKGQYVHLFDEAGDEVDLADGVVITQGAGSQLGLAAGDAIEVRMPGSAEYSPLKIAGTIEASQPQGVYVSQAEWEAGGETFVPNTALVGPEADLEALGDIPGVSSVLTIEAQRDNATGLVNDLFGIFMLIRTFAIVLAVIVLYSLGALSFTERTRDYATLSVLGFRPRDIRSLVMRENVAVTLIGLVLGVPAGYWFMGAYVGTFSNESIVYTPMLTALSIAVAVTLTVVFSLLTTLLLGRRIARIDMTGALKSVE